MYGIAAGTAALLIGVAGRYGFHRDELYFIAAGRRLAWGFVDQPPLTPLLARVGDLLPGSITPLSIRIIPAISAGALVLVAGLTAARLGGDRRAVITAAAFTAGGGFYLAVGHLLSTTTFDVLFWALAALLVIHVLDGGDRRWWLGIGAVIGVGLQNKYTIAALVIGLFAGIMLTRRRRVLTGRWPWFGAAVALGIALPNVIWQQANGWPQLEMAGAISGDEGPADYLLLQLAILSIFLVIPAVAGWRWLLRSQWAAIPLAFAILFVVFLVTGGKGYYVAPLYVPLLAAGAIWMAGLGPRMRSGLLAVVGAGMVIGLFLALPVVAPASVGPFNEVNKELGETYGWPELVDQVEQVFETIPPGDRASASIITSNYGLAGAIEVLGSGRLPQPVSGHNNYWLWGPPEAEDGPVIGVGFLRPTMDRICPSSRIVATITNPAGLENDELGSPIWLCTMPERTLASIWETVREYG